MSDTMLLGVLRMPYDLAMMTELARAQYHSRVQEAAARIESDADTIETLRRERDAAVAKAAEALRADAQSGRDLLLKLVCDLRWAMGDKGRRMQPELVEYAKVLTADAMRYRWLRINGCVEVKCESPRHDDWNPESLDAAIDSARSA